VKIDYGEEPMRRRCAWDTRTDTGLSAKKRRHRERRCLLDAMGFRKASLGYWDKDRAMGQRGGVGIAKRAVEGIRSGSHFKPLQQGFGLWVIKESLIAVLEKDADGCGRQYFHGVPSFQDPPANLGSWGLIWEPPSRHYGASKWGR
jgi:hypothetical protein